MTLVTVFTSLGLGLAFGALLQRVQASSPDRIIDTLTLRNTTILKFMLLAIGVGAVGVGALTALGVAHLNVKPLSLLAVGLGGLVFGLGFALAGYCPGTCLVGAAEGRRDALFTVFGGLLGVAAFAALSPWLQRTFVEPLAFGRPTLANVSGTSPGLAGVLFGGAFVLLGWLLPRELRKSS